MPKLIIDKTIDINAPIEKVWEVITNPQYTDQWTAEFSKGIRVESDWNPGSEVLWKDESDTVVVEGNVTKVEKHKLLRYTVFDVKMGRFLVTEEDGITFELTENDGKTILHILHGDFGAIPGDGKKFYDGSEKQWDRILPKIKELAEQPRQQE